MRRRVKGQKRSTLSGKTRDKSVAQRIHAHRRAVERYGYMSDDIQNELIKRVQKGALWNKKATFLGRQSERVTWWDVKYGSDIFRLAYDRKRHTIITFIDNDAEPWGLE